MEPQDKNKDKPEVKEPDKPKDTSQEMFEGNNCYEYLTQIRNTFKTNHGIDAKRIHMGQYFYNSIKKHLIDKHLNAKMDNYATIFIDGIAIAKEPHMSPDSYIIG